MSRFTTLKSNTDFRRAYWRGKSYTNPALVTYVIKNRAGICRIGITTSKKIGNAVVRNKEKRILREIMRNNIKKMSGLKLLVVERKDALGLSFEQKEKE